ncbi:MAG: hypothetical protein R3C49_09370 [Planctomycetaceae bacterium]
MTQTLPLTHFEELMLHQDSAAYPVSCFLRLNFEGTLQKEAFLQATKSAVQRHPLLASTIVFGRRPTWQLPSADHEPEIHWSTSDEPLRACRQDPSRAAALTLHVSVVESRSTVLVQFHHACCDGIGIFQFIRDLLVEYADAVAGKFPNVAEDPGVIDLLKRREAFGYPLRQLVRLTVQQAARLPSVWNFFRRSPVALIPHRPRPAEADVPSGFPGICSHQFDVETSSAIRAAVPDGGALNDVLMTNLFLAIRDFRMQYSFASESDWVRLMIPTSLRLKDHYRISAANILGMVFVERSGRQLRDPDELLTGIRAEMDFIKRLKLGYLFVMSLMLGRRLPGGLRYMAAQNQGRISAVFTNIGRILNRCPLPKQQDGLLQSGNVLLRSVETCAPVGRDVCAAFSAVWYANRLSLTLHYDPGAMTDQHARRLLQLFVGRTQNILPHQPVPVSTR